MEARGGGRHPGAPARPVGARRPSRLPTVQRGRKCQFVNLRGPGPGPGGRGLRSDREPGGREKAGIRGNYLAQGLHCSAVQKRAEWGCGVEGNVATVSSGEPGPQQCPACPRAPDRHTHVFSFINPLTHGRRHRETQSHRSPHALTQQNTQDSLPVYKHQVPPATAGRRRGPE